MNKSFYISSGLIFMLTLFSPSENGSSKVQDPDMVSSYITDTPTIKRSVIQEYNQNKDKLDKSIAEAEQANMDLTKQQRIIKSQTKYIKKLVDSLDKDTTINYTIEIIPDDTVSVTKKETRFKKFINNIKSKLK